MSQFFDQASLVMVPSGYKNGKVYSQKPLSTDGELTFTRSNDTATRVNSSGLIEKVRTSLFTYNTDFTNVAWQKQSTTAVADQVANPVNGAVDADLFYPNASGTYRAIRRNLSPLVISEVGISIYAKAAGKSILFFNDSSGTRQVAFDLSAGTFVNTSATLISMEALSGGWYRCSFSANTEMLYMCVSDGTGNSSVTANGTDGIYIWGQQTEYGVPTEFIGVTTSAAVSVGPVANLPRLDYSGGCPSLLLEPQRTNLLQYSDGLVPAQAFGATLTKNSIVSPDGYQNASLFTPSGGAGGVTLMTSSFSGYYTISVYLKGSVNGQKVRAFGDLQSTIIDWTITTEWVRYTATFNATNPTGQSIYLLAGSYFTPSQNNPFYVYGAQIEAGAYATSYIPTIAATTRGAEVCNLLSMSSGVASGATAGTLFIELEHKLNSTAGDSFVFGQTNGTFPAGRGYIYAADSGFADSFGGGGFAIPQSQTVKMIFRMNSLSNANIFQNGVKGATVSGTAWAAINSIQFRGAYASMKVKQILFSKSALTDAQCIELTTL